MRICRLISSLDIGGVEVRLVRLLPHLKALGADIEICTLEHPGEMAPMVERELGVPVRNIKAARMVHPKRLRPLTQYLRDGRFDIVHCHMYLANAPGTIAGRLAGVPGILAQWHTTDAPKGWGRRLIERTLMPFRDRALCVSEAVAKNLSEILHVRRKRFEVLYNGIDWQAAPSRDEGLKARAELGLTPDDCVICHVARLHPDKNHEGFLLHFKALLERVPNAVLLLVGDGELNASLQSLCREQGVHDRVKFLGMRSDALQLLAGSDISILPSRREGLSNVILESMACGVPMVCTNTGGIPELINDGVDGLLAPEGDMHAFNEQIVTLAQNPIRRREVMEGGRRRVQEFGIDRMAARTMEMYAEILRKRGRPVSLPSLRQPMGTP